MTIIPRINKLRLFNLKVPSAKFTDIIFNFHGKNTYIYAGNGTGKSATIGFIINTLSPFKSHFPKGDSSKKRYLNQYVQKDRPGAIIIEWLKDVQKDKPQKYLITGQLVIMRNEKLKQIFFIKEYVTKGKITLDNFPFTDNGKYNTFNEIRPLLRLDAFKIIETKETWVEELEKHYIDHGLVKRLLRMNETENSTKEGITFRSKRGFINYIIDDIIPVPSHAEELINSLKNEYTLFNEIPRFEEIIRYLKEVRDLMRNNENLPEDFLILSKKLEDLLNAWNMMSLTCTEIKNSLSTIEDEVTAQLTSHKKQLKEAIQGGEDLSYTLKKTSLQYYKKIYRKYTESLRKIKIKRKEEDALQEFFNLYYYLQESNEIKQRIKDLDEKKRLKLGPLQSKLDQLKKDFEEILIQTYQFTLHDLEGITQKKKNATDKNNDLIERKTYHQAKVNSSIKNRKRLVDEIEDINRKIKVFLIGFEPGLQFEQALTRIKTKILECENSIERNTEQMNLLKQEIESLKVEIRTSSSIKSDLTKELKRNKDTINQIKLKWESLVKIEGFIQEFGSLSKDEPAYHCLSKQRQRKLNDKIETMTQNLLNLKQELDIIIPKLEYYEKNDSFPTSKEVDTVINSLQEEGIVTHRGWEYYDKNRTVIDQEWIKNYSFLFEGIIVQNYPLKKIEGILAELDIFAEFPIYITQSNLFSKDPFSSEVSDKCLFLEKSVIWKYDPNHKDIYYQTLNQRKFELEKDQKTTRSKIMTLKELRENIQQFLQFTDEEKYLSLQENIDKGEKRIEELVKAIRKYSSDKQGKENQLESIQEKIKDLERSLSKWREKDRNSRELKSKSVEIPKYNKEISTLSLKISEYNSIIRELENEKIPDMRTKLEDLDNQILIKRTEIDQLDKEYKAYFTEELLKTPHSKAPQKSVTDTKTRYLSFKITIEQNQTIKEIEQSVTRLMEQRNRKEEMIDRRCGTRNIERSKINRLWDKYCSSPNAIPSLTKSNQKRIDELTRKHQRIEVRKNTASTKINELEKDITEEVKESPKSSRELKYQREELEQSINHNEILKESLKKDLNELEEKIKTVNLLKKNEKRISGSISSDSPFFVGLYEELQKTYIPGDIQPLSFTKDSLEAIEKLITELEHRESLLSTKRHEITTKKSSFNLKRLEFLDAVKRLIKEARENQYLKDYEVVALLSELEITQIPTMEEECENDIVQRQRELEERKRKLKTQVDLLQGELVKCFQKIKEFQYTKINIQSDKSFTGSRPIKIEYAFNLSDVSEMIHSFLNLALTSIHSEKEFPQDWLNYHSLVKSLMSQFLEGKIKEVRFLLPHGDEPIYSDFEQFMLMSGGQTATIAIILYCYIAHYKIKYKRKMYYQDFELAEKFPLSFPYISDNPIGNANLEELVRMQLDVAKSLNIQLLYFSGIKELENIEEFETVIPVLQSANSTVYIPPEEKYVVRKGPTIHHTPIREETFGEQS